MEYNGHDQDQDHLTVGASLAPRLKLFVSQGPKGPLQELEESAQQALIF